MNFKKAFVLVTVTGTILALAGALFGTILALLIPEHYYSVFLVPPDSDVSAVPFGAQLGLMQGFSLGLLLGLIVVVPLAWRRARRVRQSGGARRPMSRKTKSFLASVLLVALIAAVPFGFFALYFAVSAGHDRGCPQLAALWRNTLQKYETPDDAAARVRHLATRRFENGEWMFGLAQNSHGIWLRGNGTVVLKDSRGHVRAFFGHVCGAGALAMRLRAAPDLNAFYARLKEDGFVEHDFPKQRPRAKETTPRLSN